MEGIRLDRIEFAWFNDCDKFQLFEEKVNQLLLAMDTDEDCLFDYDCFHKQLIDELFSKYDYMVVTPDCKIVGVRDGKEEVLKEDSERIAYEMAIKIINKEKEEL
jgi:hypothetical protein